MFKPLSEALALVLALSFAEPVTERPAIDAAHAEKPTRWGTLAVAPDRTRGEVLTLDGAPVDGLAGGNLWIVRVEKLSNEADRAVIASGGMGETVPDRFTAVTISAQGARVERGAISLNINRPRSTRHAAID